MIKNIIEIVLQTVETLIKREGTDKLIEFLKTSDYFTAPASIRFHGNVPSGLVNHSWLVFQKLEQKNKEYALNYSDETIAIAGLFHDLCKVHFYTESVEEATPPQLKWIKSMFEERGVNELPKNITKRYASTLIDHFKANGDVNKLPEKEHEWQVDDQLPLGHGEKSVYVLQKYIQLTDEEALAIRWHMTCFDAGIHFNYPSGYAFRKAADESKLVTALFTADYEVDKLLNS